MLFFKTTFVFYMKRRTNLQGLVTLILWRAIAPHITPLQLPSPDPVTKKPIQQP
jgi:hypothetical protein